MFSSKKRLHSTMGHTLSINGGRLSWILMTPLRQIKHVHSCPVRTHKQKSHLGLGLKMETRKGEATRACLFWRVPLSPAKDFTRLLRHQVAVLPCVRLANAGLNGDSPTREKSGCPKYAKNERFFFEGTLHFPGAF